MAKLGLIFLAYVIIKGVTSETCHYEELLPYALSNLQLSAECNWGCCWQFSYPCCDTPLFADPAFMVPIIVCPIVAFFVTVVGVIFRRRRAAALRLQFGPVMAAPQGGAMGNGGNQQMHPYNPQYNTAPMYPAQPPYGSTPMYPAAPPYESLPMYAMQQPGGGNPINEGGQFKQ